MTCGWPPRWITVLQTWISGGRRPPFLFLFHNHSKDLFFPIFRYPQTLRGSHIVSFWTECPAADLWTEGWEKLWQWILLKSLTKKTLSLELAVHYDRKNLLEQIQSKVMKIPVAIITGAASGLGAAVSIPFWEREKGPDFETFFLPKPCVTDCKEVLWRRDARGDYWHQWRERKEEGRGATGPLY